MTNDTFHTYTYDAENRVVAVDNGATATYLYDAYGRRVRETTSAGSVQTDQVFDLQGRGVQIYQNGTLIRVEIYAGDRALARYNGGTTYFYHQDWLGTVRELSNATGSSHNPCRGVPFGDGFGTGFGYDFNCDLAEGFLHFTGLEHDWESNLDHTWFRQYSPTQGRWLTPDPAGLAAVDPSNPQSLNRYAYVMNNPVSFIDPLGLDCQGAVTGTGTVVPGVPTGQFTFSATGSAPCDSGHDSGRDLGSVPLGGGSNGSSAWVWGSDSGPYPLTFRGGWHAGGGNGRGAKTAAANNVYGPSLDPQRAVDCVNGFHETALGKKVQDLSYFSLTPANPNWKDNWWETAKIFSVKAPAAFLVRTASKTAATVGEWIYGGAAALATLTDMTGTASHNK